MTAAAIRLIATGDALTPDRAPGFDRIDLSPAAAAALSRDAAPGPAELTMEILASAVERAASTAPVEVALEIAETASRVALELLRGRRCEVG